MISKQNMSAKSKSVVKPVKNTFTLIQIKKMMGKKLIVPWKGLNTSPASLKDESKKFKKKITDSVKDPTGAKKIVITTVCINGVMNVISGLDRAVAISLFSYKELEKNSISDIKVVISQYPRMSQADIKNLILLVG